MLGDQNVFELFAWAVVSLLSMHHALEFLHILFDNGLALFKGTEFEASMLKFFAHEIVNRVDFFIGNFLIDRVKQGLVVLEDRLFKNFAFIKRQRDFW